mgnify:CR=1 FL=1
MSEKFLKVIEVLGEAIINNELKSSVLEYENKRLKEKLESIEAFIDYYGEDCENLNKEGKNENSDER